MQSAWIEEQGAQQGPNAAISQFAKESETVFGNPRKRRSQLLEDKYSVVLSMKICPVCKTKVFEDMDTCYNCMYKFGSYLELESKVSKEDNENAVAEIEKDIEDIEDAEAADGTEATEATEHEDPETASPEKGGKMLLSKEGNVEDIQEEAKEKLKDTLFGEFLVEFEGFLRNFLLDRDVDIQ